MPKMFSTTPNRTRDMSLLYKSLKSCFDQKYFPILHIFGQAITCPEINIRNVKLIFTVQIIIPSLFQSRIIDKSM